MVMSYHGIQPSTSPGMKHHFSQLILEESAPWTSSLLFQHDCLVWFETPLK